VAGTSVVVGLLVGLGRCVTDGDVAGALVVVDVERDAGDVVRDGGVEVVEAFAVVELSIDGVTPCADGPPIGVTLRSAVGRSTTAPSDPVHVTPTRWITPAVSEGTAKSVDPPGNPPNMVHEDVTSSESQVRTMTPRVQATGTREATTVTWSPAVTASGLTTTDDVYAGTSGLVTVNPREAPFSPGSSRHVLVST